MCALSLGFPVRAQDAGIIELGDLPGGVYATSASGMSGDGTTVVGWSVSMNGQEAFRWTETAGITGLGDLPGGIFYSAATCVSYRGTRIAGAGHTDSTQRAFRWAGPGTMLPVGSGWLSSSYARAISADGNVVVGWGHEGFGAASFRWTTQNAAGSVLPIPLEYDFVQEMVAHSVSADGTVVVGGVRPYTPPYEVPYRWTQETGTVVLPVIIPEGDAPPSGDAYLVSPDGRVIYGSQVVGPGWSTYQVCRWEADGEVTFLSDHIQTEACSFDGSFVVGFFGVAAIYDDANGARAVQDVLVEHGLDMSEWTLGRATGCSWNARRICGSGYGPNSDNVESWLAWIPLPGDTYGDISGDSRVDAKDAKPFANCMKGPGVAAWGVCRTAADLDGDGDVDLRDFVKRLQVMGGDPCGMADINGDCVFDATDFAVFAECLTGPPLPVDEGESPAPGIPVDCARADLNGNDAIDLRDFAMLQRLFPIDDGDGG